MARGKGKGIPPAYALRVSVNPDAAQEDREQSQAASSVASQLLRGRATDAGDPDAEVSQIRFSAGNPRVEHVTGVVHLYRDTTSPTQLDQGPWRTIKGPEGCDRLCVLALPPDLSVAEFCKFVGAYLEHVKEMRLVRREDRRRAVYSVLLRFDSPGVAAEFHNDFESKPFSSLESDFLCRLVYVQDVELSTDGPAPPPPAGQTELPSCPVCLERLDVHISGVVTTVCNHMFHAECLRGWQGSSCPVCRYCASADATTSHCAVCNTSQDAWICLICGHVGCGRYKAGHASDHWQASGHCFSLELESQRVWDYSSDGYVHRLIQSKTDGKMVELPAPASPDACCSRNEESEEEQQIREVLLKSKLEHIEEEYSHIIKAQLDIQREYFEGLLRGREAEADAAAQELRQDADKAHAVATAALAASREAEEKRRTAEKKLSGLEAKYKAAQREVGELRSQVDALLHDHKRFKELEEVSKAAAGARDAQIKDLEEQVHDLMMNFSASAQLADLGEEVKEGTLLPTPAKPKRRANVRR